ncbi:bifunctional 5,10-methylenetetrahydrofolate dehydrogenase/5,10-methenyltetrahydrofolate cyclohydrolase [Candidatus Microgenomates bacterium]|nr:bifunctional 5,10-methylenetetrahydrofolate dehydrogenase/5,10-methenyltetrahydrofolate cyclohydrolase [Candidatus Microgenomates bacterium]
MKFDGRALAQRIFHKLSGKIKNLEIKPHLVVILVGENPVWEAYVRQKKKRGEEIGAKVTIDQQKEFITTPELIKVIEKHNNDRGVHGIIIQRPLPPQIDGQAIALAVAPAKDVDGFHPDSPHPMPVADAVMKILKEIQGNNQEFNKWLNSKNIVVIGKGETAGGPIISALEKLGNTPKVIDSQTKNPELLTKNADILISCVGKESVVTQEMLKKGLPANRQGAILIGVGLHKDNQGKLAGDYDENEIKDIAAFYTPVPGGVGPVNVACLLENLVGACLAESRRACLKQQK